jgi:hypothetical protein
LFHGRVVDWAEAEKSLRIRSCALAAASALNPKQIVQKSTHEIEVQETATLIG